MKPAAPVTMIMGAKSRRAIPAQAPQGGPYIRAPYGTRPHYPSGTVQRSPQARASGLDPGEEHAGLRQVREPQLARAQLRAVGNSEGRTEPGNGVRDRPVRAEPHHR